MVHENCRFLIYDLKKNKNCSSICIPNEYLYIIFRKAIFDYNRMNISYAIHNIRLLLLRFMQGISFKGLKEIISLENILNE